MNLQENKHSMRKHMLRRLNRLETNKQNLESQQSPDYVEDTIGDIDLLVTLAKDNHSHDPDWDHVNDKHVATPGANHVQ